MAFAMILAACGGSDDEGSAYNGGRRRWHRDHGVHPAESKTINVAIVGNPQMEDIATLTPQLFTAETGINVEYTILEEQTLREITTRDVGACGQQFDVVMIGMYEAPQFGENGWLYNLDQWAVDDAAYNKDDLIPAVVSGLSTDNGFWASPFYAESSFLMYRKDVLDEAGLTMPDAPSWDEVARIAREINSPDMAGICLRGKPGWGDLGAAFTTVLNTFGGTWWLGQSLTAPSEPPRLTSPSSRKPSPSTSIC